MGTPTTLDRPGGYRRRALRGDPPPNPELLVLRGGVIDEDQLIHDAERNHSIYGFYGLSVIVVPTSRMAYFQNKRLWRWPFISISTVKDVLAQGLAFWDTGEDPHYDVVRVGGSDLDGLIERLQAVGFRAEFNHYHRKEK